MENTFNEWTFCGEIFYIKELDGEFSCSLKLRGISQRQNAMSTQVAEISCLLQPELYKNFKVKGFKMYDTITLSGHIESWVKKDSTKTMLIADYIITQ